MYLIRDYLSFKVFKARDGQVFLLKLPSWTTRIEGEIKDGKDDSSPHLFNRIRSSVWQPFEATNLESSKEYLNIRLVSRNSNEKFYFLLDSIKSGLFML